MDLKLSPAQEDLRARARALTESTPPAFERLFAVFVDACRGAATSR